MIAAGTQIEAEPVASGNSSLSTNDSRAYHREIENG